MSYDGREREWHERKWGAITGCNGKEVGVRNSGGRLKVREQGKRD